MNRSLLRLLTGVRVKRTRTSGGFTLIELLVVIVIISVAAAIAAPSWVAFTNRQKVNKVNDRLLGAVQEARSKAKEAKVPQRLTFRNNNGEIEYAITRTDVLIADPLQPSDIRRNQNAWKKLVSNQRDGIRPGLVFACTNVVTTPMNQAVGAGLPNAINTGGAICRTFPVVSSPTFGAAADPLPSLVFDPTGGLPLNSQTGLMLVVGLNRRSNTTTNADLIPGSRRCVLIDTLLGSTRTARDAACPSS